MDDKYEVVMDGLRGILNDDDCYAADRDAAERAIDYIRELLREIDSKEQQLVIFKNELAKVHHHQPFLPHHRPLDIPTSRGTTHGQLMVMHHEAETMHSNPPPDQPMG